MSVPKPLRLFAKLLIGIMILAYVFRVVPVGDVLAAIASARVPWLLGAVPLVLLNPYLSAARLKILTDSQALSFSVREILEVNFVTRFYGLALPGQLATGAVRWFRLTRIQDRKAEVLAAILFSRVLHLTGLGMLGTVFFLVDPPREGALWIGLVLVVAAMMPAVFILLRLGSGRRVVPLPTSGWVERLISAGRRFRDLSPSALARVIGLSLAENLSATIAIYFLAIAVGASVPFVSLGWIRAAVQLLVFLPISISGFGVREGSLLLALQPYGVAGASALALSLLIFGISLLHGAIGGLLELRRLIVSTRTSAPGPAVDRSRPR